MRRIRDFEDEPLKEEGAPPWIITFADLFTLLLIFFILLFSYARSDLERFKNLNSSIKGAFGARELATASAASTKPAQKPEAAATQVQEKIEALITEIENPLEVAESKKGILVRIDAESLFEEGATELSPKSAQVLEMIQNILRKHNHDLVVVAHTNSDPAKKTPSNWELGALRGSSIVRALIARGVAPGRLSTTSYADTRPVAAKELQGSDKKNDRVEFIFEPVKK